MKLKVLATHKNDWDTETIEQDRHGYMHVVTDGGTQGSHAMPPDHWRGKCERIDEAEAFRLMREWGVNPAAEQPAQPSTEAKHTPGPVWAGPYKPWIAEDGKPFLADAVTQDLPCGCKVVGNGTLPHPLTVELCQMHKATELLEALKGIADLAKHGERNGNFLDDIETIAQAAISKATR